MRKTDIITLALLITLTFFTAFFAGKDTFQWWIPLTILVLSGIKFLLVSFNFMEIKKAHSFWKTSIILYLMIFVAILTLLRLS